MTEKEMRRLKRAELLEMLLDRSIELQQCREKLAAAEEALEKRKIIMEKAGSIAEASLMLSGIFEAAEEACRMYTEGVSELSRQNEQAGGDTDKKSRGQAERMIADASAKRDEIIKRTKAQCMRMKKEARADAQKYWDEVYHRLDGLCSEFPGLRESLGDLPSAPEPKRQTAAADSSGSSAQ